MLKSTAAIYRYIEWIVLDKTSQDVVWRLVDIENYPKTFHVLLVAPAGVEPAPAPSEGVYGFIVS